MEEMEQRHKKEQKELLGNDALNVLDKIKHYCNLFQVRSMFIKV